MQQWILINLAIVGAVALKVERGVVPKRIPGVVPIHLPPDSLQQQRLLSDVSPKQLPAAWICTVMICCQFVAVYAALAFCRSYHELTGTPKARLEASLRAAAQTVTYGPMLCVLFIAYQMRVEYLSQGRGEPQHWVQTCMYALTLAVLLSTLLTCLIQLVTGKPVSSNDTTFDLERPTEEDGYSKPVFYTLSAIRYLVLLCLFGGLAGVILGICAYLPPGIKHLRDVEPPSPAVMCTMILAVIFFSTQFVVALCRSYLEYTRVEFPQIVGVMHAAAMTMEFAPMLAVLFMTARMQALQYNAQPQEWAQSCMFAATGAMCVTSLLAIMVPASLGGSIKTNKWGHDVFVEAPNPVTGYIFVFLRFVCMLCFYAGALGVVISISVFESPGPMVTLPMSPTVRCVVNLACQFFLVYFVTTVMQTVSDLSGGIMRMEKWRLFSAVESARSTLAFAPMLSLLFVATKMHALAISGNAAEPQACIQDAMQMATWSLQMAGLMCLGSGLLMAKVRTDYKGNMINEFTNWYLGSVVVAIRYLSMFLLYGCMVLVIAGLFTMTPESTRGRGSMTPYTDDFKTMAGAFKPSH